MPMAMASTCVAFMPFWPRAVASHQYFTRSSFGLELASSSAPTSAVSATTCVARLSCVRAMLCIRVCVSGSRAMSFSLLGRAGFWQDEDGAEIVDVGQRRAGDDQIAAGLEERIGVVAVEQLRWIGTGGTGARQAVGCDESAGVALDTV